MLIAFQQIPEIPAKFREIFGEKHATWTCFKRNFTKSGKIAEILQNLRKSGRIWVRSGAALPPPMQPQLLYLSTLPQLRLVSFIVYHLSFIAYRFQSFWLLLPFRYFLIFSLGSTRWFSMVFSTSIPKVQRILDLVDLEKWCKRRLFSLS